jgi:hypothetical protein
MRSVVSSRVRPTSKTTPAHLLTTAAAYGESTNKSGIYGTIAVIFFFQGLYAFAITPLTTVYPTEVSQYKLRTTGIAIFRFFDSGFGLMSSFALSYAMADLGWKFYLINASYNIIFFAVIYLTWVETKGLPLEEIALKFEDPATLGEGVILGSEAVGSGGDGQSEMAEVLKGEGVVVSVK